MPRPLDGRIALVTGASRGIGGAVALELASAGAHVIALARTKGALEALDDTIRSEGNEATLVPCDLKDFDALDPARRRHFRTLGQARCFNRQCGRARPGDAARPRRTKTMGGCLRGQCHRQLAVDPVARPLLRAAEAGRVIFISSGAGHAAQPKPYFGPYAIAKAALDALARTYAAETMNISRVKVMAVNPGPLRTRKRAEAMPGEEPLTLRTPEELAPKILALCMPEWTQTGKLYDFPTDRVLSFMTPS